MKIYLILIFIIKIKNILFNLDSDITNVCFVIEGSSIKNNLKINYMISGDYVNNVKFILKDIENNKLLKTIFPNEDSEKEKKNYLKNNGKVIEFKIPINHKNNYLVCFNSHDGSNKEVSFNYNHIENFSPIENEGLKDHLKYLYDFDNIIEKMLVKSEQLYSSEKEYPEKILQINSNIKGIFLLKSFIFLFIAILQFLIFFKLISKKFKNIKQIVIT